MMQAFARCFQTVQAKETDCVKKKEGDGIDRKIPMSHDQKTERIHVGDDGVCYLSGTKRVHKTRTCSNMSRSEQVQLCAKCFKLS